MSEYVEPILTVTVTGKTLFDLKKADNIYKEYGAQEYVKYMVSIENDTLEPGPAFYLIKALNSIKHPKTQTPLVKVTIVSQTPPNASVVIQNSIDKHNLSISQYAFTGGRPQFPYIKAFNSDLFLSFNPKDVTLAMKNGIPSALLLEKWAEPDSLNDEVRIAFDGDAVIFSDESEKYYRAEGLDKFIAKEKKDSNIPMREGPFKKFLSKLHEIQLAFPYEKCPIVTALITARGGRVLKRPLITLRHWEIDMNVAIGLDGVSKKSAIEAFKPHIFFDDRKSNCEDASFHSPSAQILGDDFDDSPQIGQ